MILVNFCGNFPSFWLIFGYPDPFPDPFHETDPDPCGRNETDPNGSGSETLAGRITSVVICYYNKQTYSDLNTMYYGQLTPPPPFFLT